MNIIETRLQNLLLLAGQYRFDKEFCEAVGIQPSYLSQLRRGDKTLGHSLARQIERRLDLGDGELDQPVEPTPEGMPGKRTIGGGLLSSDVMTMAFAVQGMEPSLRASIVRTTLLVSAAVTQAAEAESKLKDAADPAGHHAGHAAPTKARKSGKKTAAAFEVTHVIEKTPSIERRTTESKAGRPKAALQ